MSWVGLVVLAVGAYLAWKLVGALLKILMFVLALVGAYWFLAPHLGWPTISELFYVLGPDFGGRRIEEVAHPANLARQATDHVVEGVVGQVTSSIDEWVGGQPAPTPPEAVPDPAAGQATQGPPPPAPVELPQPPPASGRAN